MKKIILFMGLLSVFPLKASADYVALISNDHSIEVIPSNPKPPVVDCAIPENLAKSLTRTELISKINNGDNLSNLNTSCITDFSDLFWLKSNNDDISNWDVGNGRNFSQMFRSTFQFDQDLSKWNMSNAENLEWMFSETFKFNQDISKWDVSNVTNFSSMFYNAMFFNQDISGWDVSSGVNFQGMFDFTAVFNQDISKWDVSNGINFGWMFRKSIMFNQDISKWNVDNATDWKWFKDNSGLSDSNSPSKFL